jgi:hypothetical protein
MCKVLVNSTKPEVALEGECKGLNEPFCPRSAVPHLYTVSLYFVQAAKHSKTNWLTGARRMVFTWHRSEHSRDVGAPLDPLRVKRVQQLLLSAPGVSPCHKRKDDL